MSTSCTQRTFSSKQLESAIGVTNRELQWWDEQELITPRIQAHSREYSLEEAIDVMVVKHLRGKGLSLQKVRRIIASNRNLLHRRIGQQAYLVCDVKGDASVEFTSSDVIRRVLASRVPMVVVDVHRSSKDHLLV